MVTNTILFLVHVMSVWMPTDNPYCAEERLHYDPMTATWQLVGRAEETVRYELPGLSVDLVRVSFPADDQRRNVWIAAGLLPSMGSLASYYIPLGPWDSLADMEQALAGRPVGPLLRVSIDPTAPHCEETACDLIERLVQIDLIISEHFIASGGLAPGWYPWGFVLGSLSIMGDSCAQHQYILPITSAFERQ